MTAADSHSENPQHQPALSDDLAVAPTQALRPEESSSHLAILLDEYLAELQAGRQPDRKKLLADHPELATQLENCLCGIEFIHRASAPTTASGMPTQLGDFRIVREVGRGGMGVVYEAEQISLKRRVALKVLRFGAAADTEAMQRFQREAETVATLHHTNIVPIFAIGCEQGVNYYAMQFIEGRSLAEGQGVRGKGQDIGLRAMAEGQGPNNPLQLPSPLSPQPSALSPQPSALSPQPSALSRFQLGTTSRRGSRARAPSRRDSSRHQAVEFDS